VADIYHWHWRRHLEPREGRVQGHLVLRAMVGGVAAIVVLAALVAGIAGGALYALVFLLLKMVGR
jgi:hypothetical protein